MSDILREIDEAMRQERMEKFWKENGNTLVVFVVATILMTAVISGYRSWDRSERATGTDRALALMEDKTFPENIKEAKLDMRGGLRGIVLINGAQDFLNGGKPDEALALYTKAAEDKNIPGEMRGLAVLMQARLAKDVGADEKLMKNLAGIAGDNGNPWQQHARIEAASYAAANNDYKTARKYLAGVMDEKDLPDTLYKKANALDHVYALKEQKADAATKTGS